jgi:hypothetical protein
MENRIDVVMKPETKEKIFQAIKSVREEMPYLIKLSEDEHKSLQKMEDGRKPFVHKCFEIAAKNEVLDPGSDILKSAPNDLELYLFLSSVENQLHQLLELVSDTKQLAGAEAYDIARFIYMKAKMNVKLGIPGSQAIVDELNKLYRPCDTLTHMIKVH